MLEQFVELVVNAPDEVALIFFAVLVVVLIVFLAAAWFGVLLICARRDLLHGSECLLIGGGGVIYLGVRRGFGQCLLIGGRGLIQHRSMPDVGRGGKGLLIFVRLLLVLSPSALAALSLVLLLFLARQLVAARFLLPLLLSNNPLHVFGQQELHHDGNEGARQQV